MALEFGAMGLFTSYGIYESDKEILTFLDYVYEKGELFYDVSDFYGDSDELTGE